MTVEERAEEIENLRKENEELQQKYLEESYEKAKLVKEKAELLLKIKGLERDCEAYNYTQHSLQEENKELKAKTQWHYIKDGDLPTEEKDYLIYSQDFGIEIRNYYLDTKGFSCRPTNMVIAWCELPEVPKEE